MSSSSEQRKPLINPILAKAAILALLIAGSWLAVQWWPAERPEKAASKFMDDWRAGSLRAIVEATHEDEVFLMGANKEQIINFLKDLNLAETLELRDIASASRAQGGMRVKFRDSSGKRRTLDLLPDGKRWRYGLGSLIVSSCRAQKDSATCILNVADSMQRHGIKRLVIAENWLQTEPSLLRKYSRNPEFAFSPLNRVLSED